MQIGISPKVKIPSWALFVLGAALVIVGEVTGDETLSTMGGTLVVASGGTFALGYKAPPGLVDPPNIGPASDELLTASAKREIR
jgi:hypothetical protein